MAESAETVETAGRRRSTKGSGVKLKSPTSQGETKVGRRGSRAVERKEARSEGDVLGQ